MRKLEIMATYICDCCGKKLKNDNGWVGYDETDIIDIVQEDIVMWAEAEHEWIEQEGEHYCPNCYSIDDDDNIVIKSS